MKKCIYCVLDGSISLYQQNENNYRHLLRIYSKDEIFGVSNFFKNSENMTNAQSNGFSIVCKIQKNDFKDLLNDFPEDFVKFHLFSKDFIKLQKN